MCPCLICLQELTDKDFESGEAIYLDCGCKGENAARHARCAREWFQTKRNYQCEVCKVVVSNIAPLSVAVTVSEASCEASAIDVVPQSHFRGYVARCCVHALIIGVILYIFMSRGD